MTREATVVVLFCFVMLFFRGVLGGGTGGDTVRMRGGMGRARRTTDGDRRSVVGDPRSVARDWRSVVRDGGSLLVAFWLVSFSHSLDARRGRRTTGGGRRSAIIARG